MNSKTRRPGGLRTSWLAAALLVAGVTGVVSAGGSFGGPGGGGDAIGSLPGSLGGPEPEGGLLGTSPRPQLVLSGSASELAKVIVSTDGRGSVQHVLVTEGLVELYFFGEATVWLDKAALAASSVSVRFDVPPWFGTHVAKVKFDGHTVSRMLRNPIDMPVALTGLLSVPEVDLGAQVSIVLSNAKHQKQVFGVQDVGAWVRLDQRF
jgi:hypothetical protein